MHEFAVLFAAFAAHGGLESVLRVVLGWFWAPSSADELVVGSRLVGMSFLFS